MMQIEFLVSFFFSSFKSICLLHSVVYVCASNALCGLAVTSAPTGPSMRPFGPVNIWTVR
jgi:hypothetical protein